MRGRDGESMRERRLLETQKLTVRKSPYSGKEDGLDAEVPSC